jgi:WD40-like Beta Propeller Repeat
MSGQRRHAAGLGAHAWRAGAAALVSLLLLGAGWAGAARAAYPGSDGRIAFVRDGNIYSIEPNGTGLQRLTNGGHDSGPRWSPDGQEIAYLSRGNLWIMAANGADKTRITDGAPGYTDARPSWSPNGRYLAFVKTRRGHSFGYLTRYDTVTGGFVTFSVPYNSEQPTQRQVKVPALPDPVAWAWAATGSQFGSFILFEGAPTGEFCQPGNYCLDAIGRPHQNMYRNAFPSFEESTTQPTRVTDPDWFPITPQFDTDVLTSQESCTGATCTHSGINLGITSPPVLPGAYEAVYSPEGRQIAYVLDHRGAPTIYLALNVASPKGNLLTTGTEPDWQPL